MKPSRKVAVTGAGGFIGHHLVSALKKKGYWVRGIDVKLPEYEASKADDFYLGDLRSFENCVRAVEGVDDVYNLAADMGGIWYITSNHASLSRNNILMNAHMVEAARLAGVKRYLFSSSACVYPQYKQTKADITALKESDAVPAEPEDGYGWEKLFAEQLVSYYAEDHALDVRLVRFHNIYGPLGTYEGGKEKAPAALSRKVAEAKDGDSIEVWGDGKQTRSFCYVGDCVEGLVRIMDSGFQEPINLGTEELVTVDELTDIVIEASGKKLKKHHDTTKPQGVRGRNSDNTLIRKVLGWEPKTTVREGIALTYPWILKELERKGRAVNARQQATTAAVARGKNAKA